MKRFQMAALLTMFALNASNHLRNVTAQDVTAQEASAESEVNTGVPIEKVEPTSRPLNLTLELMNGTSLPGTLVDADVVNIKTAFGEAAIPLSEIAGIRFATREDVSTTVVMINGDSITGATDVKLITVETDWGVAKVNGSAIQSLLLIPNLKWMVVNGVSGKRWSLVDSKTSETAQQSGLPNLQTSPNSQSSGTIRSANPGVLPIPAIPDGTYYRNGVLYRSSNVNQ